MSAHPIGADPLAGGPLRHLLAGLRASLAGFAFVRRERAVLRWALAAELLYLAVWAAVLWAAASYDGAFIDRVLWQPGPAWWQTALHGIAEVLLYLLFWLLALLLAYALALPLTSPLLALVAEATEAAFFSTPAPPSPPLRELVAESLRSVWRGLLLLAVNLAGAIAIWLAALLLGLALPPVGTAVGAVAGGAWSALWVGMSGVSYALENNRTPAHAQTRLARDGAALLLGFGLLAQWLAFVPFTAPLVSISGTLLVCRLHAHGRCPLPLRAERFEVGAQSPRGERSSISTDA